MRNEAVAETSVAAATAATSQPEAGGPTHNDPLILERQRALIKNVALFRPPKIKLCSSVARFISILAHLFNFWQRVVKYGVFALALHLATRRGGQEEQVQRS